MIQQNIRQSLQDQTSQISGRASLKISTITSSRNKRFTANNSFSYKSAYKQEFMNSASKDQIKENYLNSQFVKRRQTLKQITMQNKKIYTRIISQKSMYSSNKLHTNKQWLKRSHSQSGNRQCESGDRQSEYGNRDNKVRQQNEMGVDQNNKLAINCCSINNIKREKLAQMDRLFMKQRQNNLGVSRKWKWKMQQKQQKQQKQQMQQKQISKNKSLWVGKLLHFMVEQTSNTKKTRIV